VKSDDDESVDSKDGDGKSKKKDKKDNKNDKKDKKKDDDHKGKQAEEQESVVSDVAPKPADDKKKGDGAAAEEGGKEEKKKSKKKKGGGFSPDMLSRAFVKGLEEAIKAACALAMAMGGFAMNEAIKLELPEKLGSIKTHDIKKAFPDKIKEIEEKMNKAAEKAAEKAIDVFVAAVQSLSVENVAEMLTAGGTACTDFMKDTCVGGLTEVMKPIIDGIMDELSLNKLFKGLEKAWNKLPGVKDIKFDLVDHCVEGAIKGLFHLIGEKEKELRKNPMGAMDDAVKEVFSNLSKLF
jgi:hypothetical protein